MEKTPDYFDSPPYDVPNRIASTLPGVKLLLIICDPTKRAFSDYIHEVSIKSDLKNANIKYSLIR